MLEYTKVSYQDKAKLSSMGISNWASLLVYKWDHLPWRSARKLEREDEDMPTMRSIQRYIVYLERVKL